VSSLSIAESEQKNPESEHLLARDLKKTLAGSYFGLIFFEELLVFHSLFKEIFDFPFDEVFDFPPSRI